MEDVLADKKVVRKFLGVVKKCMGPKAWARLKMYARHNRVQWGDVSFSPGTKGGG